MSILLLRFKAVVTRLGEDEMERLKARLDRIEEHLGLRLGAPDPGPPFKGYTPASGMHHLKDVWKQWAHLVDQSDWLTDELDVAIGATEAQAPNRPAQGLTFLLNERITKEQVQNGPERRLEWDLYNRSGLGQRRLDTGGLCPGPVNREKESQDLFRRLVGFQVPLLDNNGRDGWDKIDLIGMNDKGEPVVVELKREEADDTPLRVIMEGVAYAIALRKVWSGFCAELAPLLLEHGINTQLQPSPIFHVLLLAPCQNWQNWEHNILKFGARDSLARLINQLPKHGISLRCGSVDLAKNLDIKAVAFP